MDKAGATRLQWRGGKSWAYYFWSPTITLRGVLAGIAAMRVAYWWYYDRPLRMDADKNGIPCETVYSGATVNAFWFQ
jgi:hypothetical protein